MDLPPCNSYKLGRHHALIHIDNGLSDLSIVLTLQLMSCISERVPERIYIQLSRLGQIWAFFFKVG